MTCMYMCDAVNIHSYKILIATVDTAMLQLHISY